ncbi:hypothetical protein [Flexithrix dorotheae]|uniref:hypothetical protein n=1 Tax=Flexithrix dorotheae TaxID=70993 RepID=UPI00146CBC8E|nr:hypothetical protein [Flexithrix dorotheae]
MKRLTKAINKKAMWSKKLTLSFSQIKKLKIIGAITNKISAPIWDMIKIPKEKGKASWIKYLSIAICVIIVSYNNINNEFNRQRSKENKQIHEPCT